MPTDDLGYDFDPYIGWFLSQPGRLPTQLSLVRGNQQGCCSIGLYLSGLDYAVLVPAPWAVEAGDDGLVIRSCDGAIAATLTAPPGSS